MIGFRLLAVGKAMEHWLADTGAPQTMPSTTQTLGEIEAYLAAPPHALKFAPAIEFRYAQGRERRRRQTFFNDAVVGLITMNLAGVFVVVVGGVTANEAQNAFLAAHVIGGVPILSILMARRRVPALLELSDLLGRAISLLAIASLIAVSRAFHGEIAVYQTFMISSFMVRANLLGGMSFQQASKLTKIYLPVLILSALTHSDFSWSASAFITCLYLMLTGISLAANRRMEQSERINYLTALRETLRSAEIVNANAQLKALSLTDPLTGLLNRRGFDERFRRATEDAARAGEVLTVLMLDIDHFKLYNDTLGHPAGDVCIRAIAAAMIAATDPRASFAGRVGGEEFALVLPGLGAEAAAALAAKVRHGVAALHLPHPALGSRRIVTLSIGAACMNPAAPETPEALLMRADTALYRAKRAGRDRAEFDLKVVGG